MAGRRPFPDDEPVTGVICAACGGHGKTVDEQPDGSYRTVSCRWCSAGAMSPQQMLAWRDRKKSQQD